MAKYRLERLILLISTVFIFSGCGYKFLTGGGKKVFLHPVLNSTMQPRIDVYLSGELKKTFVEYPEFSIVNRESEADCVLHVTIKKWERLPLFFSKEGRDEITIARFYVAIELTVSGAGQGTFTEEINDTLSVSLAGDYQEDAVLQKISQKLAGKIYFYLLEKI